MVTTELPTGPLRGLQWGWPRAPDPVEWGKEQVPASQWSVEADVPPPPLVSIRKVATFSSFKKCSFYSNVE